MLASHDLASGWTPTPISLDPAWSSSRRISRRVVVASRALLEISEFDSTIALNTSPTTWPSSGSSCSATSSPRSSRPRSEFRRSSSSSTPSAKGAATPKFWWSGPPPRLPGIEMVPPRSAQHRGRVRRVGLQLVDATGLGLAVAAPAAEARGVAEAGVVDLRVGDLDDPLGSQRDPVALHARVPAAG